MKLHFSISALMAGFVFGVFGFAFLKTGKRDASAAKILIGLTLMIYPYFVTNDYLVWIIGGALTVLGYKIR